MYPFHLIGALRNVGIHSAPSAGVLMFINIQSAESRRLNNFSLVA